MNLRNQRNSKNYEDTSYRGKGVRGKEPLCPVEYKTRGEIIKEIKPSGDKIIKDTEGIYSDKIMFKGEYLKVKNAKNGYEAASFIDIYKDGVLSTTREIRHAIYEPQSAILYEGTEDLMEGMRLPKE